MRCTSARASFRAADEAVLRNVLEHADGVEGFGNGVGEAHHHAFGVFLGGAANELLHDQGGAVVHVDGSGEVEDDDFVLLDVRTNHPRQFIGGGDGKNDPAGQQARPEPGRSVRFPPLPISSAAARPIG